MNEMAENLLKRFQAEYILPAKQGIRDMAYKGEAYQLPDPSVLAQDLANQIREIDSQSYTLSKPAFYRSLVQKVNDIYTTNWTAQYKEAITAKDILPPYYENYTKLGEQFPTFIAQLNQYIKTYLPEVSATVYEEMKRTNPEITDTTCGLFIYSTQTADIVSDLVSCKKASEHLYSMKTEKYRKDVMNMTELFPADMIEKANQSSDIEINAAAVYKHLATNFLKELDQRVNDTIKQRHEQAALDEFKSAILQQRLSGEYRENHSKIWEHVVQPQKNVTPLINTGKPDPVFTSSVPTSYKYKSRMSLEPVLDNGGEKTQQLQDKNAKLNRFGSLLDEAMNFSDTIGVAAEEAETCAKYISRYKNKKDNPRTP